MAKELEVGTLTLKDILAQLARPGRDPREDLPAPVFKQGVLKLEDLSPGMELTGTVLNVVDFGCFVDIGMHDSGLVHVSQMADRFIRDPHEVVAVGDIVKVWVLEVDKERRRVSLTMVPPGSQRPRHPRGGPPRDRRRASGAAGRRAAGETPRSPAARGTTSRRAASGSKGNKDRRRSGGPPRSSSRPPSRRDAHRMVASAGATAGQAAAAPSAAEAPGADHRGHEGRQGTDADLRRPDAILRAEARPRRQEAGRRSKRCVPSGRGSGRRCRRPRAVDPPSAVDPPPAPQVESPATADQVASPSEPIATETPQVAEGENQQIRE